MAGKDIEKQLRARRRALGRNNLQEAASICNIIGVYYTEIGDHKEALQYHQEELRLSERINDEMGVAVGHRKVGECLADLCQFSKALKEQEQYLNIVESLDSKEEIQRAYATIGRIWYMRYKAEADNDEVGGARYLEKATQAFNYGLKACEDLEGVVQVKELMEMRARLYLNLGLVAEEKNDFAAAEDNYQQACGLGKEFGSNDIVWQSLSNLGELLINARLPNRALVPLEDSLKYAEVGKNRQHRADSLLQIAMVHIYLVDFTTARQYMRSALKLNVWNDDDYQSVVKKYKIVCKIINISNQITSSQLTERLKLYDTLGDICSNKELQFYNAAIKFYKNELEIAENHGLDIKQISKIIFSLAETYLDNKEYEEALSYYRQELEMWKGQPAEESITWVNIARVYELSGNTTEALSAYDTSLRLASSVSAYKVLGDTYRSLISFCESSPELENELEIRRKELEDIIDHHPEANQPIKLEDSQEAMPLNSQELKEELVLSSSGSEDEEEYGLIDHTLQARKLRGVAVRNKAKNSKRNEKGETPLHVAAISGSVSKVKELIKYGADVHIQDYCGWTPLHEACNHGNLDVVKCLLDHGANINDVGGANCDRTTALMDATCNGHVGVVSLLIERGADLSIKNSNGMTAYGLIVSYLRTHSDVDDSYIDVRDILHQAMISQGLQKLIRETKGESQREKVQLHHNSEAVPALISDSPLEEDYPLIDSWLLNDMEQPPCKRKRNTNEEDIIEVPNVNRSRSGPSGSGNQSSRCGPSGSGNQSSRCGPSRSGPIGCNTRKSLSFSQDDSDNDWEYNEDIMDCTTPTQQPVTPPTALPISMQPILRVKVRLEGTTYLIPSPWQQEDGSNTTVDWLVKKTTERYFLQHGRKPLLSLTTSEGALLCPTDPLSHVIQDGDEIVGVVKQWETPHLDEHYRKVSEHLKGDIHPNVSKLFQSSPSGVASLDFSDFGLQARHGSALCHALLSQSYITSLNFCGNHLTDLCLVRLMDLLHNLPSLYHLDLSCTGLTHHGITNLTHSSLLPNNSSRYTLQVLKLNHNDLGSLCGSSLSLFLSHSSQLAQLSLNDCGLTSYTFEPHTGLIKTLESLTRLEELSLADNDLDEAINSLYNLKLTKLDISSTIHSQFQAKFPPSITQLYLSCCPINDLTSLSSLSHLKSLNLSASLTSSSNLEYLTSCLLQFKELSQLDLSANKCISNNECLTLLLACKDTPIIGLLLTGCSLMSPLPEKFVECVNSSGLNELGLLWNDLSTIDKQKLLQCSKCYVQY